MAFKADRSKLDEKVWERKPPTTLSPKAFLQETLVVPKEALSLLRRLTDGYTEDSFRFVVHILASETKETERWVPISAAFIKKFAPKAEYKRLADDGVLEMTESRYTEGKSREWRLAFPAALELAEIASSPSDSFVDAGSGRKQKPAVFSRRDKNKNLLPRLILGAHDALKDGYFNRDAVQDFLSDALNHLRAAIDTQRGVALLSGEYVYESTDRLLARYSNDARCYAAIQRQRPECVQGSTYKYPLAYTVQKGGRLQRDGIGLRL